MSVRVRRNPKINIAASAPIELMDWTSDPALETVFTWNMEISEIETLVDEPIAIDNYTTHAKFYERAVHEVPKSITSVFVEDRRDGWVRARMDHREIMPVFTTKKHILNAMQLKT